MDAPAALDAAHAFKPWPIGRALVFPYFLFKEALIYSDEWDWPWKKAAGKAQTAAIPRGMARICNAAGRFFLPVKTAVMNKAVLP
ncbi:MAG: hypothetical protein AB1584_03545 [Pseudomonadota bacterium]